MKLVLAVVSNNAAEGLTDALLAAGFRTTRLASTGGFRREGNTTIMINTGSVVFLLNDHVLYRFSRTTSTCCTRKRA